MKRFTARSVQSLALQSLCLCALLLGCSDEAEGPPTASDSAGMGGGGGSEVADPPAEVVEVVDPTDKTVRPSAGCATGNASPPRGSQTLQTGGQEGTFLASIPFGYDPSVPYPLGFVFHGANNTEVTCRGGGNCTGVAAALEGESVVLYMGSFGTSWTGPERDQNVAYFDDLLEHAKATYCIDERRVYALGTSSGAHFSNILGCRRPNDLLAIVPGAGERLEKTGCQPGRFAALVLHGIDDEASVPFRFGEEARDFYAMQNGCDMSLGTTPPLEGMHAEVRAARTADQATFGCVDFQGCDEGLPVRWCEHSEGGYDGTTHGWPVVGGQLAWDFIREL